MIQKYAKQQQRGPYELCKQKQDQGWSDTLFSIHYNTFLYTNFRWTNKNCQTF